MIMIAFTCSQSTRVPLLMHVAITGVVQWRKEVLGERQSVFEALRQEFFGYAVYK
jgi:hypothetical protein